VLVGEALFVEFDFVGLQDLGLLAFNQVITQLHAGLNFVKQFNVDKVS